MGWLWSSLVAVTLWLLDRVLRRHDRLPGSLPPVRAPEDAGQVNHPGAVQAALDLQSGLLNIYGELMLLRKTGSPPALQGAAWSWPPVFRAFWRLPRDADGVSAALFRLRSLGSQALVDTGFKAAMAGSTAMTSLPMTTRRKHGGRGSQFDAHLQVLAESIVELSDAVRGALEEAGGG